MQLKNYTNIEQSKKLAEILPLESADACYNDGELTIGYRPLAVKRDDYIPCWSLTALLGVLDFSSLTQNKDDEWEVCVFDHDVHGYIEKTASNPVDTCVVMIEKLHERKIL